MKAFIYGCGAQGRVVLDILRAQGSHTSVEFLDDNPKLWRQSINAALVVGNLEYALLEDANSYEILVALGNNIDRINIAAQINIYRLHWLNAIHPSAVIMSTAILGKGNMIGAHTVINTNTEVGNYIIINNSAVVEHDSILEDGVCVSPGVQIGGRVIIHQSTFIGTGAIILPRISIGTHAIVAAGSVVTKDVPDHVLVKGSPAKIVSEVDNNFDWKRLL